MNQIINMIVRQVMRQLVNRGVNAGFNQASKVGRRKQQPQGEIDDHGNFIDPDAQQQRGSQPDMRAQSRQAKQSMKVMRRISKF
jgi:hypothetical protein